MAIDTENNNNSDDFDTLDFLNELSFDETENQGGENSTSLEVLSDFSFDGMPSDNVMNITDADINTNNIDADRITLEVGGGDNDIKIDTGFNTDVSGSVLDRPSAESSTTRIPTPDLPPDFFTLLLGLALVAIIIASILLFLEVNSYEPDQLSRLTRP
jgi:hypothetical protein